MILLSKKKRRIRQYMSRPFKNREKIEKSLKEILDLMKEKKYQEALDKEMIFIPKLEETIVSKIKRQTLRYKASLKKIEEDKMKGINNDNNSTEG